MRHHDQQTLISFGRCYHYAIPDTSRISTRSNSNAHINADQLCTHVEMHVEIDVSSQEEGDVPMGQKWAHNVPPWSSQGSEGDSDAVIKQIACTFQSTLFLTAAGKIYQQGLLHGFMMAPLPVKVSVPLPLKCIQISAGRHFCLALLEGGVAVASWGAGHFGQLGISPNYPHKDQGMIGSSNDPITFTSSPCIIERLLPHSNDSPVVSVAAGDWHALALTKSGRVWAWGCNRNLQCGRKVKNGSSSTGSPSSSPSPAPTVTIPLPVSLGPSSVDGTSPTSFHVTQIAAGRSHSMIIARETFRILSDNMDGSQNLATKVVSKNVVYCWGNSHHGQCGNYVTRRSVPGVLPSAVESLRDVDVCQISAAGNHSMALTAQGRILCWGSHLDGQLGIGIATATRTAYKAATDDESATYSNHNLASTSAIQCKPRLVSDLDFVAIAAGQEWNKLQQSADSLSCSQSTMSNASLLSSIPRIVSVQAGATYSTALDSLGQLYVWGSNDAEQLGVPIPKPNDLPFVHEDNNALRVIIDSTRLQGDVTNPLLYSRPLHVQTFDSRHNVLLPLRVEVVCDTHVDQIGCGPNHMWCVGRRRSDEDTEHLLKGREYSKTLYEVQVEQHKSSVSLCPPSSEKDIIMYERALASNCDSSNVPLPIEKTNSMNSADQIIGKQVSDSFNGELVGSQFTDIEAIPSKATSTSDLFLDNSSAIGSSRSFRDESEQVLRSLKDSSASIDSRMPKHNNVTKYPVAVEDPSTTVEVETNGRGHDDKAKQSWSQSVASAAVATATMPNEEKQKEDSPLILDAETDIPRRFDTEGKSTSSHPKQLQGQQSQIKNRGETLIKRISKKFLKPRKSPLSNSGTFEDDVSASRSPLPHHPKSISHIEESNNIICDQIYPTGVANDSMPLTKASKKSKASDRFFGNRRKKENN